MKARTYKSKKAKGKRLEQYISSLYRKYLEIEAKPCPLSGADSMLKGDILKRAYDEFLDECKNQEKLKIWEWWRQAEAQCQYGEKPLLHFTANNKPTLTVIRTEDFFNLRKEIQDYKKTLKIQ